jgi:hypothetical protein
VCDQEQLDQGNPHSNRVVWNWWDLITHRFQGHVGSFLELFVYVLP